MKERWLTFALAAAALALFYTLFVPKPATPEPSRPLSTGEGPDGLAGAWRWLRADGIPVTSLRERFDRLDGLGGTSARGNVLISSAPWRLPLRLTERAALLRWLARGNTLVLLAALDDTPRWAGSADPDWTLQLQQLSGISFQAHRGRPVSRLALLRPSPVSIVARGRHPLMAGVQRLQVLPALAAARWDGQAAAHSAALAIAERADDGSAVLWVESHGAGQVVLLAVAGAFSNAQIALADNARLLGNIVAWSRAPDGQVMFDDAHQGLTDFYDPHAFFADARLHRTLAWIVLGWLVWVLGAQRLRNRQAPWQAPDEVALIDASGRFYSHCVSRQAAARRLLRNFFDELHRRRHQPEDGSAPWEWLARQPRISAAELAELQRCCTRCADRRPPSLAHLQNLLSELRGRLA